MIEFPPDYPEVRLLKKAMCWAIRNRFHKAPLTELAPKRSLDVLRKLVRLWEKAGLGQVLEPTENGRDIVVFSLNGKAVFEINKSNQKSIWGWLQSVCFSNWIAFGALVLPIFALLSRGPNAQTY